MSWRFRKAVGGEIGGRASWSRSGGDNKISAVLFIFVDDVVAIAPGCCVP